MDPNIDELSTALSAHLLLTSKKESSILFSPKQMASQSIVRESICNLPFADHSIVQDLSLSKSIAQLHKNPDIHLDIEYNKKECQITEKRLARAREACSNTQDNCQLSADELLSLQKEQVTLRQTLLPMTTLEEEEVETPALGFSMLTDLAPLEEGQTLQEEDMEINEENLLMLQGELGDLGTLEEGQPLEDEQMAVDVDIPQDPALMKRSRTLSQDFRDLKAKLYTAKIRARMNRNNDGVLGVQGDDDMSNSVLASSRSNSIRKMSFDSNIVEFAEEGEEKEMDIMDITYVRKPNLAKIIENYDRLDPKKRKKYTLRQVLLSRRFHLYKHRFANAQYNKTILYPTLVQPKELYKEVTMICGECSDEDKTEKRRSRPKGHRFIITADTQFGILMDGFAMKNPSWSQEIEISRRCVEQINNMEGDKRPLFVCVCGDLVDTESSFSGAIASWKKVMTGWERNLVFDQQAADFKRVWAHLDHDIALICLCGNHDVGNRPTKESIKRWTSKFGDDYLSFWVNGTFNICLNNCLFSNPSGAQDLYEEELAWMEDRLKYARANDATHIFIYGHFPWFLKHEEEKDDEITTYSAAPIGWGPEGSKFEDGYFTIPYKQRKVAMELFRKYDVTACFSGHFHQNVVTQTSWGMPMIVTGPLSMNLKSEISHELSNGETIGLGMRIVDVGERGEFKHKWVLLDNEKELHYSAIKRIEKSLGSDLNSIAESTRKTMLGDDIAEYIKSTKLSPTNLNEEEKAADDDLSVDKSVDIEDEDDLSICSNPSSELPQMTIQQNHVLQHSFSYLSNDSDDDIEMYSEDFLA